MCCRIPSAIVKKVASAFFFSHASAVRPLVEILS